MNPLLIDPNNPAPDVSPDDGWDDAEGFGANASTAGTILPPRRVPTERADSTPADHSSPGLRIESNVARREAGDHSPGLEVQEISGSVIRLEQTAPGPPKVARQVVFQERPPEEKKTLGEGRDWGTAQKFSMRWATLIGTGVTSVVILALMMLPSINKTNAARTTLPDHDMKVIEEESVDGMDAVNALIAKQPEAEQMFRSYLSARVAGEALPLLLDADSVSEIFRRNWRQSGIGKDWAPSQDTEWQVMKSGTRPYALLEGTLPDFSKFSACFVTKHDKLLLDWKATTGYGTATFDELSKKQGDPGEIRGHLSQTNFYTTTWPEVDYQSYQLLAPVGETSVWCYARRTEKAGGECADLLRTGEILDETQGSRKITVRLAPGPAGALPNQWQITEVLHTDWLTP
ncbi:MAG: hypothetical protein ABIT37_05620 [Luteolibacter sp.]